MEKLLESEQVYDGRIIKVSRDTVELPNGAVTQRELVKHTGGVGILAEDEEGFVYMVRQYRYGVGRTLLEIPAGKLESGEDPFECAKRELREETGFTAKNWSEMGYICPTPAYNSEINYLYYATGLSGGEQSLDENELLELERVELKEVVEQITAGQISDAKTIAAVLKLWTMRGEVRDE